jgi:hypothetical protein
MIIILKNMKKLLLFSFLIISNFTNGQIEKNTNDQPVSPNHKRSAYDIYLEIKERNKERTPMSEYAKASSNNRYYNNDVGSSKYDSEINWATDINGDDVQGSLNKFRQQRQEEDLASFIKIGLIIACILGFFFLIYKIFNNIDENSTDKTIPLTIIKDTTTSDSSANSDKEDLEQKEGKVAIEILESQINFLDKIITARNGKAVCKNLEKVLENTNTEILTTEESLDIMAKYSAVSRVTSLMFAGLNEETALLKTKLDLTDELNQKTQDTLEGILNNFYSKI